MWWFSLWQLKGCTAPQKRCKKWVRFSALSAWVGPWDQDPAHPSTGQFPIRTWWFMVSVRVYPTVTVKFHFSIPGCLSCGPRDLHLHQKWVEPWYRGCLLFFLTQDSLQLCIIVDILKFHSPSPACSFFFLNQLNSVNRFIYLSTQCCLISIWSSY